ncbi:MAG: VCBS repeat-containing protein [Cyclobacteriaceae bacterium]
MKKNLFVLLLFQIMVLSSTQSNSQTFFRADIQAGFSSIQAANGVSVADFDLDNDLDIFVQERFDEDETSGVYQGRLFRNNNDGSFTDITSESGIDTHFDYSENIPIFFDGGHMGASWGDYNRDNYPDLFLSGLFRDILYRNNGDGTFTDVTSEAGFQPINECHNVGATWFDYDNDGFIDLFIPKFGQCENSRLYHNNGDGTFTENAVSAGVGSRFGVPSYLGIPFDFNQDGYMDLYVSNDFGEKNFLYINQNGTSFTEQAESYGLEDNGTQSMGMDIADFNQDGLFDLYITNIDESSLYQNNGGNSFTNVSENLGVFSTEWAWGIDFFDYDLDKDEDLFVANGFQNAYQTKLYKSQISGETVTFSDVAEEEGLGGMNRSYGLVAFDYDNDGDLDIFHTDRETAPYFYENRTIESNAALKWIKISLEGTESNINGFGSIVEVHTGDDIQIRSYHGATLFGQNIQPVHVGLGSVATVDKVVVKWPSGRIDEYLDIDANQHVKAKEADGLTTLPTNVSIKIPGCTDLNSCSYDPSATINDGSCTYLEPKNITGNASVGVLTEQTYSYPTTSGSSYQWEVSNGHIVEGQGESSIKVKWGIGKQGKITVIERNNCEGTPVSYNVSLNAAQAPENASVARMWNEVLLEAVRKDFARPTIHARNLFHTSIAMYDAWAIFNNTSETYLIGKQRHNYINSFDGFETSVSEKAAIETAISYASYRILSHRFQFSPNQEITQQNFDNLMSLQDHDISFTSTDYSTGNPAALGNFIAKSVIDYGKIDGSHEDLFYPNIYYEPINDPLTPDLPGNPSISDAHRWQPLQLEVFIDQAGNLISGTTPEFLSPEWGNVNSFSLKDEDANTYTRDGNDYVVYHDPGTPPFLNQSKATNTDLDLYKWNFAMVSIWSAHLDPTDGVMWDISPKGIGNIDIATFPTKLEDHSLFYNLLEGGDNSNGRTTNPITGSPYESQMVPRGDYARVLAEFWADGPDSETPPGHWFVLLNHVNDHPDFERKFNGNGETLDPLEWDVKAYFTMGGAMHDAAISAWSIKGWHDYIRPISAIRYMAENGQSSDPSLPNYHENGIPLVDGYIELVEADDPLASPDQENIGKIKVFAWKGHSSIVNTSTDQAGVGWILAENWWPYQRPSFVTPPFAGFVSGHSTYSRAAAEVMTLLTGSEYFPGGMGEFVAKKNEFLVFEEGPSQDIVLQWATYQDASDQCSLSRIWGGIHPPADDIPGRLIGEKIGKEAYEEALEYFNANLLSTSNSFKKSIVWPNPVEGTDNIFIDDIYENLELVDLSGKSLSNIEVSYDLDSKVSKISLNNIPAGLYLLQNKDNSWKIVVK